jgi:hypothetical protein
VKRKNKNKKTIRPGKERKQEKSTAELLLVASLYIHSSGRLPTNTPKENETTCLEAILQKLTFFFPDGWTDSGGVCESQQQQQRPTVSEIKNQSFYGQMDDGRVRAHSPL